jgi:hypothetical protein
MRTYFWISLFTSHRITANQLIESNVILIANKEFKKNYIVLYYTSIMLRSTLSSAISVIGIEDTTGMVSDLLNEKYFRSGELGDFRAMTRGLIDVSLTSRWIFIGHRGWDHYDCVCVQAVLMYSSYRPRCAYTKRILIHRSKRLQLQPIGQRTHL